MDAVIDGFDLDALLAPIPGESPAGTDPRADFSPSSLYFRLRDARAEARAAERQADASGETGAAEPAQWGLVRRLALELLRDEAKDLEVAAWYTEALLRSDGLAGLAAGVRLMTGLAETYWEILHPRPDAEDGMARRTAPVAGLNGEGADGTLIQPLRKLPLFELPDGAPLALWQYQQSAETAGIGDAARRAQRLAAGVLPFDDVENAARTVPARFATLRREATAAMQAWNGLERALDALAGADAPPTGRVRDLLGEIVQMAERYAPAETQEAPADVMEGPRPEESAAAPVGASGRIATREDALRALDAIADYFRRTEPHSPLAYTLREAVRRARLTWPELLEEIVPDADHRGAILTALGIRPPPPPE